MADRYVKILSIKKVKKMSKIWVNKKVRNGFNEGKRR